MTKRSCSEHVLVYSAEGFFTATAVVDAYNTSFPFRSPVLTCTQEIRRARFGGGHGGDEGIRVPGAEITNLSLRGRRAGRGHGHQPAAGDGAGRGATGFGPEVREISVRWPVVFCVPTRSIEFCVETPRSAGISVLSEWAGV